MLTVVQIQLSRLNASEIVAIPLPSQHGLEHIKLSLGALSCVVKADGLLRMLEDLPDNAGPHAVIEAIQNCALRAEQWAG
jgi:hypothetical protein